MSLDVQLQSHPSAHRCCLLKLSRSLEEKEINELLYLSEDFIPPNEADLIKTGLDLFRSLERHGKLGSGNYSYLTNCLKEIGRIDLVKTLLRGQTASVTQHHSLQIATLLHGKKKAIQDKRQRYLQRVIDLQQLSQDTQFWKTWMSNTLQMLSAKIDASALLPLPSFTKTDDPKVALKAATKLISGVFQFSASFLMKVEKHHYNVPATMNVRQLEQLEEDLIAVLNGSNAPSETPTTTHLQPVVQLKEQHPLSLAATETFSSLSEYLKEICSEYEAQRQLRELEESLTMTMSFLHINAHLCFAILTLMHLTDMVTSSEEEVLDREAQAMIATLVHIVPDGAMITVAKPILEALKGTSVLTALKEDEKVKILFNNDTKGLTCCCKANKCIRFGILTMLLTLYKSSALTQVEWKGIQSRIVEQFRKNLSEPNFKPFLEVDMIVLNALQHLFKQFPKIATESFSLLGDEEVFRHFTD